MNYSAQLPLETELLKDASEKTLSKRQAVKHLRDRERGYSINTKQIVLAFAVEFTIIGLILTNIYVTIAQLPDLSTFKITQAMLFPLAMAMVELARVPLAVAVRTQNSWIVKMGALIGVLCAVAVTSNSLYAIGATSFAPRLEETHRTDDALKDVQAEKARKQSEVDAAVENVTLRKDERDTQNRNLQALNEQLSKQAPPTCTTILVPSPVPGAAPTPQRQCGPPNPNFRTLNAEIATTKPKLEQTQSNLIQAEAALKKTREELRAVAETISKAESENRGTVFQSQLHSLAAMLFRVDPEKVTPAQLKTIEFYLVFISSIAAAFSSTLIAMTAVRRIDPLLPAKTVTIPDEAVAYLFGPLIIALRKEADEAVAAALNSKNVKAPETKGA